MLSASIRLTKPDEALQIVASNPMDKNFVYSSATTHANTCLNSENKREERSPKFHARRRISIARTSVCQKCKATSAIAVRRGSIHGFPVRPSCHSYCRDLPWSDYPLNPVGAQIAFGFHCSGTGSYGGNFTRSLCCAWQS